MENITNKFKVGDLVISKRPSIYPYDIDLTSNLYYEVTGVRYNIFGNQLISIDMLSTNGKNFSITPSSTTTHTTTIGFYNAEEFITLKEFRMQKLNNLNKQKYD